MRKILTAVFVTLTTLALLSCKKDNPKEEMSLEGCWELTSVQTKAATIGDVTVEVYLEFGKEQFTVYQKLGDTRFTKYAGSYTLSEGVLTGTYSDGQPLSSKYTVTLEDNRLILETSGGKEADIYNKIDTIPESVIKQAF
ncbi:MAG: lipocalin family protein [Candidatus Cryptobacteroides sp.]